MVLPTDPDVIELHNLIYGPFGIPNSSWGIFDHGRKLVTQSAFWQGGGQTLRMPSQSPVTDLTWRQVTAEAPDESYVYGGVFHEHYGHFLLSTFCRYWNHALFEDRTRKVLFHSDHPIGYWFARPYVRTLFEALGLTSDRFVRFETPVRVRNLVIPAPAMEETGYVHVAMARACNAVGRAIAGNLVRPASRRPVFLSKGRLATAVGRLANEDVLCRILQAGGVEILHPEAMSFPEQVALFHNREVVCAQTGSSLHTSMFAPGRTIVGLCYGDMNFSSFPMLDEANGTRGIYVHPGNGIERLPTSPQFLNNHLLTDPERTGAELLGIIDACVAAVGRNVDPAMLLPSRTPRPIVQSAPNGSGRWPPVRRAAAPLPEGAVEPTS